MRVQRAVLVTAALLSTATTAGALCVVPPPICQSLWSYDAVFDGTVIKIERRDVPVDWAPAHVIGNQLVTFTVNKAWRGIDGTTAQLLLPGGYDNLWIEDAFHVQPNGRYLIFAFRRNDGFLTTSTCEPTVDIARASSLIADLDRLLVPSSTGWIQGSVVLLTDSHGRKPLTTDVRLDGPNGLRRETTSSSGEFRFEGLTPGTYSVSVKPPPAAEGAARMPEVRLEHAPGCAVADFVFKAEAPTTLRLGKYY